MNLIRVMIDIETLSTSPSAAVIAIAAVIWDETHNPIPTCASWFIDRDLVFGYEDPETLQWWNSQNPVVKDRVFGGNLTPREALQGLNNFLCSNRIFSDRVEDVRCYASPGMFDFPILRNQYQRMGITPGWSWRTERCLSTLMKEIKDNFGVEIPEVEIELKHHPVHDCLGQIQELNACLKFLQSRAEGRPHEPHTKKTAEVQS